MKTRMMFPMVMALALSVPVMASEPVIEVLDSVAQATPFVDEQGAAVQAVPVRILSVEGDQAEVETLADVNDGGSTHFWVRLGGPIGVGIEYGVFFFSTEGSGLNERRDGFLVTAEAGTAGAKLNAGAYGTGLFFGGGARVSLFRTAPWATWGDLTPNQTYAGGELEFQFLITKLTVGLLTPILGGDVQARTMLYVSTGIGF